jgi:hypothetical protein
MQSTARPSILVLTFGLLVPATYLGCAASPHESSPDSGGGIPKSGAGGKIPGGSSNTGGILALEAARPGDAPARDFGHLAVVAEEVLRPQYESPRLTNLPRHVLKRYLVCHKLSYMRATMTISLPPTLRRELGRVAKGQGMTESEFVRRAVQQQIWADAFEKSRRLLIPKSRAKGIYSDEDVFKVVS